MNNAPEQDVLKFLRSVVRDLINLPPEQIAAIRLEATIGETLQLDSLAQVVIVAAIEEKYGCHFDPEDWQQINTVADLVRRIAKAHSEPANQ
jgi:acyl carrier protein